MMPLVFFLCDFAVYSMCHDWFLYSLFCYFLVTHLRGDRSKIAYVFTFCLLLVQDYFLHGRFGVGLVIFVPIICFNLLIRETVHSNLAFLTNYVALVLALSFNDFVIKWWILSQNVAVQSTFLKILINVIVLTLMLVGTWGNRFWPFLTAKGGKSGLQTGKAPYKNNYR